MEEFFSVVWKWPSVYRAWVSLQDLGSHSRLWLTLNEWPQKVRCSQQTPMVSLASLHLASCGSAKDQTQGFQCVKDTLQCPLPREGAAATDSALPNRQSPLLDQIHPCLDLNESLSAGTCRLFWLCLSVRAEDSCSYLLRFATAFEPSRAVEDGQPSAVWLHCE